ncbi:MAG TPA: DUF6766 family protein [Candidatus Paceibacterota bacterium]|nr:DUF6766 family protein [Candidatus Paceibacterota bacterium]
MQSLHKRSIFIRYGYLWATLALFIGSLIGHWVFGWYVYVDESQMHGELPEVTGYTLQMLRDTLENWQSEFLQLIWQVAGLAFLLFLGSPQSKEGSDRLEEKVDLIAEAVLKDKKELKAIDQRYGRA